MAKNYKLVKTILKKLLSVRTEFGRLYLVDDQKDEYIAESMRPEEVKDYKKWAVQKLERRYKAVLKHRDYHQKEIDQLNLEAGRLAMFLNNINDGVK